MDLHEALKGYHESAREALKYLAHLALLSENHEHWVEREESKESVSLGYRRDIEGLVIAFSRRPPRDSPERQQMIAGRLATEKAPFALADCEGVSVHDAVFLLTNQAINWVALALCWPDLPNKVDLAGLSFRHVEEIVAALPPGLLPEAKVLENTANLLEIEYTMAVGVIAEVATTEDGECKHPKPATDDSRIVAMLGETEIEISTIAEADNKTVNEKMREIITLNRGAAGYNSERWGTLLGVTGNAIRKTPLWKTLRAAQKSGD